MKKVIAITGPMGAGKTTILEMLANNYATFSVDKIQHHLYCEGNPLFKMVKNEYPEFIVENKLCKESIGQKILTNEKFKNRFEDSVIAILIPYLKKLIDEVQRDVIVEIPYIKNAEIASLFTKTFYISVEKQERVSRIIKRDNVGTSTALLWTTTKTNYDNTSEEIVIDNSGNVEDAYKKIVELISE